MIGSNSARQDYAILKLFPHFCPFCLLASTMGRFHNLELERDSYTGRHENSQRRWLCDVYVVGQYFLQTQPCFKVC